MVSTRLLGEEARIIHVLWSLSYSSVMLSTLIRTFNIISSKFYRKYLEVQNAAFRVLPPTLFRKLFCWSPGHVDWHVFGGYSENWWNAVPSSDRFFSGFLAKLRRIHFFPQFFPEFRAGIVRFRCFNFVVFLFSLHLLLCSFFLLYFLFLLLIFFFTTTPQQV